MLRERRTEGAKASRREPCGMASSCEHVSLSIYCIIYEGNPDHRIALEAEISADKERDYDKKSSER